MQAAAEEVSELGEPADEMSVVDSFAFFSFIPATVCVSASVRC
jgi:hypothetical protein